MPATHDLGYRLLFAHPELVRELITDFTSFKLLDEVALSAFERVNPAYVSERLSARQTISSGACGWATNFFTCTS